MPQAECARSQQAFVTGPHVQYLDMNIDDAKVYEDPKMLCIDLI